VAGNGPGNSKPQLIRDHTGAWFAFGHGDKMSQDHRIALVGVITCLFAGQDAYLDSLRGWFWMIANLYFIYSFIRNEKQP
jgi:hypothetical protein